MPAQTTLIINATPILYLMKMAFYAESGPNALRQNKPPK